MIYEIADSRVEVLGDVHLGKRFRNGVPLHRRGDREKMVWEDFVDSLNRPADLHVQVGDLFDKAVVPFDVILDAATAYRLAPRDRRYVILRGNHDASRQTAFRSAFDVFTALIRDLDHVHVVADEPLVWENMLFCGWHPFKTSTEVVGQHTGGDFDAAFGHWDTAFSEDNLVPFGALENVGRIFTGHDHKHRREGRLEVVGSMQPYAHGEDDGEMYVTLTTDQLDGLDLSMKCVRVDLKPGEEVPDIDCLQLTTRRLSEEGEPVEMAVDFESFDMMQMFDEAFAGSPVAAQVRAKFEELREHDTEVG